MPMLSDKSSPSNASASLPFNGDLAHCSHSAKPMRTCMSSVALTSSERRLPLRLVLVVRLLLRCPVGKWGGA
jgi:hypothetical protein